MSFEGGAALAGLFQIPSEPGSALIFGLSKFRLLTAALVLTGSISFGLTGLMEAFQPSWWQPVRKSLAFLFSYRALQYILFTFIYTIFLTASILLLLGVSPAISELVTLRSLLERAGWAIVWIELVCLQLWVIASLHKPDVFNLNTFFHSKYLAIIVIVSILVGTAAADYYLTNTRGVRLQGVFPVVILASLVLMGWYTLHEKKRDEVWFPAASRWLLLASIGLVTFLVYQITGQLVGRVDTPDKAYWHVLADAFVNGRLYIESPKTFHDLTLYQGKWYVPNPPLPALILMPFAAIWGAEGINTVLLSITLGAINTVLVYLILESASNLKMIPTGRSINLWLTAVFALGTSHWWLSFMGQMWYISQLFTVLFSALAVLLALKKLSPWLVGASLGFAVLSRPNVFALWPFLFGITLFLQQREKPIRWKPALSWGIRSALTVCAAVGGLLLYNYLRFQDFFDFGYVTIHGAAAIVDAVQTYGMFNIHFLPANIYAMFLKLPEMNFQNSCFHFSPSRDGISILAMMPVVVFMFRRFKLNYWTAGAWISVLLSTVMLLLYHNTGSWQIGYRYLLDFIPPVLLLLAFGLGTKTPSLFKVLSLLGIVISAASILWWFTEWWWC